jgi:Zn-dependent protease with chaperone function
MVRPLLAVGLAVALVGGCATSGSSGSASAPAPAPTRTATRQVDPAQAERLRRAMLPLIQAMDHPVPPGKVKLGIMADPHINAANAGNGAFYVTTGLLEKADDDRLLAVLAHEVAHEDLGHVSKAQALGTGLNIGMILLDQIVPGSGALTPIAGELIFRGYSRKEEYQADAHGADLLQRVGRNRQLMIDTLTWLMQAEGGGSGGFFSTHPATGDRIEALRNARS